MKSLRSPPYKIAVQGHRGSPATHLENTIEGFFEAYDGGAHGIELDLQRTCDGKIVIVHDFEVGGRPIKDWHSADLGATPLEELCEKLQEWNLRANLEIKRAENREHIAHKVMDIVEHYGIEQKVYYSSFDPEILRILQKRKPTATFGYILEAKDFSVEAVRNCGFSIISPDFQALDRKSVDKLHALGFIVAPWTVNEEADWIRMIDYGVDEIMTDRPRDLVHFFV